MPDDKIEILDDIITDMDIETITLDDVELDDLNENGRNNIPASESGKSAAGAPDEISTIPEDLSSSIEEISFEPIQEPVEKFEDHGFEEHRFEDRQFDGNHSEDQNENIQIPNLDSIESIREPEIPVAPAYMSEEPQPAAAGTAGAENFEFPSDLKEPFTSEDDIISIEGSELDRLIYSGFKTEGPGPSAEAPGMPQEPSLNDIPIIEESGFEEEIKAMPEEPANEENFIPPISLQMKEPGGMDFNFDLSAIPDVSEVEEDEPIALSLDELNKIDISEENVLDYEAPAATEAPVPEVQEFNPDKDYNIPLVEEENVEISLDELNRIEGSLPEAEKVSSTQYIFDNPENKEMTEQAIDTKIDILSDSSKEELRKVLGYLDSLLENLPEDKIKEFAKSEYYDLYVKILSKLGI
ncbi:MAG: hypothetical protein ABSG94_03285 [Brevinematales bacterium]|jgi:hypothetical protein